MVTARKTTTWVLALGLLLALCVLTIGKPASAQDTAGDPSGSGVQPILVDGNPDCATLPDEILPGSHFEFKIEGAPANGPRTDSNTGFQVTIANADMKFFDWSSLTGVDAVIVKGGDNADAFVYDLTAESNGDTLLHAPLADNGEYRDISHVSFCWDDASVVPKPLTAEKTATGTYDRTITWNLTKTVDPASHMGVAGDSFNSLWTVTATKDEQLGNYKVTGTITIDNPNGFPVDFSVTDELDDGTLAGVDCDSATADNQDSGTVAANDSATCSYSASPPNKNATSNEALVTSKTDGVDGTSAQADITWNENVKGDEEVKLDDPRLNISKTISGDTTETSTETFTCPTDKASYTTNPLVTSYKNVATLKGIETDLTRDATVTVTCRYPWVDETATGKGYTYKGSSNWFMYTAFNTSKVDLIAGQKYDAGDIYMTRDATKTYITITLHNGFRWANVSQNLKIQDFASAPKSYVQPGSFKNKFTVSQSQSTYTAAIKGTTAQFYGIHADLERFVN